MNPYLILVVGLLLVFLEFYLPGIILGTIGTFMIITSVILFAMQANSPLAVLLFLVAALVGIALVIRLAIVRIRRTAKDNTMYLNTDQEGYVASTFDRSTIGKGGVAVSDLKPSGRALIDGKEYQVASQSGYLSEGTEVIVIGGLGAVLTVKPMHKETP